MTNTETIKSLCSELRLGTYISENYKMIDVETHEEFLIKLLKGFQENRRFERRRRYLKQAGFDLQYADELLEISTFLLLLSLST